MILKNIFLSGLFLILISIESIGQNIDENYLIGIWQDSQNIADGWSNNYQFFENGIFKFNYSQMNCKKRVIYLKGNWSLKYDLIVLSVKEEMIIEGGELVKDPICDSMIVNGIDKTITLKEPRIYKMKIIVKQNSLLNDKGPKIEHIQLDSINYYKLRENPLDY